MSTDKGDLEDNNQVTTKPASVASAVSGASFDKKSADDKEVYEESEEPLEEDLIPLDGCDCCQFPCQNGQDHSCEESDYESDHLSDFIIPPTDQPSDDNESQFSDMTLEEFKKYILDHRHENLITDPWSTDSDEDLLDEDEDYDSDYDVSEDFSDEEFSDEEDYYGEEEEEEEEDDEDGEYEEEYDPECSQDKSFSVDDSEEYSSDTSTKS